MLLSDPNALLTRIDELRERINRLHQLAGPELRQLLDRHDFGFSAMNALLAWSKRLVQDVIAAKELVTKLCEAAEARSQQEMP